MEQIKKEIERLEKSGLYDAISDYEFELLKELKTVLKERDEMVEMIQILIGEIERHPKPFSKKEKIDMAKNLIKKITKISEPENK